MSLPEPLKTLFEREDAHSPLPLPSALASRYGRLAFPAPRNRPYVIANFVETLDGVVSLGVPGHAGGGDISGHSDHDKIVMGLLRAAADAVIIGAGVLRVSPNGFWTPEDIYPPLAGDYERLRGALGKSGPPLHVVVSGSGLIDLTLPIFASGRVPVLIVTTEVGRGRFSSENIPESVTIAEAGDGMTLSGQAIIDAIAQHQAYELILSEAGPHLFGSLLDSGSVDELFITLAPQLAGRDPDAARLGLVEGVKFAPDKPLWGNLISIKQGGSHLFLRYALPAKLGGSDQGSNETI